MKIGNKFAILEIVLIAGGILMAGGGARLHIPFFINVGIMLAACGCIIGGIDTIKSPYFSTTVGEEGTGSKYYTYSGLSAVMWGICMLVTGVGLLAFAAIRLLGIGSAAFDYLKQHPGIIFLGGGLCLVSYSLHEVLGAHEENRLSWTMLHSIPARIFFLVLIVAGVALLLLGLLEMVSPAVYHELIQHISNLFTKMPE
jgi:hypothetical protein